MKSLRMTFPSILHGLPLVPLRGLGPLSAARLLTMHVLGSQKVKKVVENFTALAQKKPPPELQPITPVRVTRPTSIEPPPQTIKVYTTPGTD